MGPRKGGAEKKKREHIDRGGGTKRFQGVLGAIMARKTPSRCLRPCRKAGKERGGIGGKRGTFASKHIVEIGNLFTARTRVQEGRGVTKGSGEGTTKESTFQTRIFS